MTTKQKTDFYALASKSSDQNRLPLMIMKIIMIIQVFIHRYRGEQATVIGCQVPITIITIIL